MAAKLLISFSGRRGGNCDQIASYLAAPGDRVVFFRELGGHPCCGCAYECFHGSCPYRDDGVYDLYGDMLRYDKVVLLVPMYCGAPSSLYFLFRERGQDYFMHNDTDEAILQRLYLVGVYGSREVSPDFIPCLESWFQDSPWRGRVLGLERHRYGQRLDDRLLDIAAVRARLSAFLADGPAGAER